MFAKPETYHNKVYCDLINKLLAISGFPGAEKLHADLLKNGKEKLIEEINQYIYFLNLAALTTSYRIYLIDTAIKAGHPGIVKTLAEKFEKTGYAKDICIPSADNKEHSYRPVFWLAAIVTNQPGIPKENYQAIEKYLCEHFKIQEPVEINGRAITRTQYLSNVDKWKHEQNIKFYEQGLTFKEKAHTFVRYRRHELLNEIENGVTLKKTKK